MQKKILGIVFVIAILACVIFYSVSRDQHDHMEVIELENSVQDYDMTVKKPVIYLYPERDNTAVTVDVDIKGEFLALDPKFNRLNGWSVIADKNGTITLDERTYQYLFWEADLDMSLDMYSGFCIKGSETKAFFESTLSQLGLNAEEIADYTEYWLPRMQDNPYNVISFQGSNYTKAAQLTVEPKPDTLIRVLMAWAPSDHYVKIQPQVLEDAPTRTGFTVVEWGGGELETLYLNKTDMIE